MASAALLLSHGCQIAATVRAGAADVVDAVFRTGALPVEVLPVPLFVRILRMCICARGSSLYWLLCSMCNSA